MRVSQTAAINPIHCRVDTKHSTDFHTYPISTYRKSNNAKHLLSINLNQIDQISMIFVYGSDFTRSIRSLDMISFWKSTSFWIVCAIFVVAAIILYQLRRVADLQCASIFIGLFEVFVVLFGGGNIRAQHRCERVFFAIMLVASFFLVSLYLADFSMHSVLYEPQRVNTFDELAKRDVPFYVNLILSQHEPKINAMLRRVIIESGK